MNRRQFLHRGAMVAVSVAPVAVLAPTKWTGIAGPRPDAVEKLRVYDEDLSGLLLYAASSGYWEYEDLHAV